MLVTGGRQVRAWLIVIENRSKSRGMKLDCCIIIAYERLLTAHNEMNTMLLVRAHWSSSRSGRWFAALMLSGNSSALRRAG